MSIRKLQSLAAIAIVATSLGFSSMASAQVSSASGSGVVTPPEVLGISIEAPVAPSDTQVLGETVSVGGLALTGTDVAASAVIGAGAIAVGAGLLIASRRRKSEI